MPSSPSSISRRPRQWPRENGRCAKARARIGTGCIVAGTDFSDPALSALDAASAEARRLGGRVICFHSLEVPFAAQSEAAGWAVVSGDGCGTLEAETLQQLRDTLATHGVEGECRVGREQAGRALVREAEAFRADLLVVGTHGRTGISRTLLGSVAEFVVSAAPCSVLVVRLQRR